MAEIELHGIANVNVDELRDAELERLDRGLCCEVGRHQRCRYAVDGISVVVRNRPSLLIAAEGIHGWLVGVGD